MADEPLSDADVFGSGLSDQQVFGAQQKPVEADPVNTAAFQQTPAGKALDASQGNWFTRPFSAAGIAVKDSFTDGGSLGLSQESVKKLQDVGVLEDYKSNYLSIRKAVTGALLMPAAAAGDALMRTINAGITGTTALAGGIVNEAEGAAGLGRENPEAVAKDAQDFANYLYITSGISETGAPIARAASAIPTMKDVQALPAITKDGEIAAPAVKAAEEGKVAELPPAPVIKAPVANPMLDEDSGNLNLKYITGTDDAKSMLARTAQAYADESGVTITHAQTVEESQVVLDQAMTETADGVPESLANYMRGDPVNRPLLYAARQLTVQATQDAIKAVKQAVATGDPADVAAALKADDRMMAMTGARHEVSAEAGRVLESHKITMGEDGADLESAADKMAGMSQEERIRLMSTFDSPEAIAKFARDVKKPTWGEMGIFYVINNYLSGPITHMAYAASWAAQTVIRAGLETPVASAIGRIQRAAGVTLEPAEVKALQVERESVTAKIAAADSGKVRMTAKDSLAATSRLKEINTKLNNGVTVMPGEAAARFYGIGEGALDSLRAAGRALRTGNIQMLPGEMAAAKQAAKEAVDAAIKEGKSTQDAQKAGETAYNKAAIYSNNPILDRADFIKNPVAKALTQAAGLVMGVPTRVIAGIHSLQKFSGYAESSNALAYRQAASEGLTSAEDIGARIAQIKSDMSPAMIKQSAEEAKYAALMGKPGKFGQAVENLAHVNGWTRMVVPFSRVVTNLANQKFLERTPAGLLSEKIRGDLMGSNGAAAQANTMAKMITGSTLLAGGAWLASQGINNGQAPDNPNERARAYMAGTPPYTVRIGDVNIPHRMFGVAAGSLSLGADVHSIFQTARGDDDTWAIMGNAFHVLGNDMLQENALKGAADLYDAIRNRDQNAAKVYVLNALTAAATPYSVGMSQVTRALDPVMRSTMGNDFWDRFKKTEEAHIPWESGSLLPQVDIFGRPMQRGGDYQAMLRDPVMQNLTRLNIFPAKASTRILNVKLNDQQYYDYATKAGSLFYHNAGAMVNDPNWPKYDTGTQVEMIHQAQKDARADARQYMCMAYPTISKSCAKYSNDLVKDDE